MYFGSLNPKIEVVRLVTGNFLRKMHFLKIKIVNNFFMRVTPIFTIFAIFSFHSDRKTHSKAFFFNEVFAIYA